MLKIGIVELTQGNINNNHFYLSKVMDLFPSSAVGGTSKEEAASQLLELTVGFGDPIKTDIAGDKKIFRQRRWVGDFFKRHDLKAGDKIVIEKMGEFRFHIYPQRS